ncbi:PspA/IM30 family protein [Apostichopus japonicus]|uniref:PspA/IM30 family protein n=1 Tax=Stichopus japonicus TaxID=307972 RepID=A0A2G8JM42_STIJA|nr:PspA/IM30 family protein [Apostichopus japonicus]
MDQKFINFDSVSTETKCMCLEPDETFYKTYSDYDHEGRDVILCKNCGCENREITVCDDDGQSLGADTELTNQSSYSAINAPAEAMKKLRAGDHVAWEREKDIVLTTVKFKHHAIVDSIDDHNMRIIEYKKLPHAKKFTIQQTTYSLSCADEMGYGNFFCINYPRLLTQHNPPRLVLNRALSQLGEGGYNLFFNNCESFATFCKRGVSQTKQVSDNICKAADKLKRVLGAICHAPSFRAMCGGIARAHGIKEIVKVTPGMAYINLVGGALYIIVEGMFCFIDIYKLYGLRHDRSITTKHFVTMVVKRVGLAISKGVVGGATSFFGAGVGAFSGLVLGAMVTHSSGPGMLVGATAGYVIGSVAGGVSGVATLNGSRTIIWSLLHSKNVQSIESLLLGDHVILPGEAFLHPRCHAIVSAIDRVENKIKVIRNDYTRGVVEEWIDYVPMKRMVYGVGECYPVPTVLENARSQIGKHRYNIATYNCKTFAVEHKMKKELNF